MKCLALIVLSTLIASPLVASPEVLPVTGTRYATYDMATRELAPTPGPPRYGNPLWAAETLSGYYTGICGYHGWAALDWGDIPNPIEERTVAGFRFGYGTNLLLPKRIDAMMTFYTEENGWNSDKTFVVGFLVTGLPTTFGAYNSWWITVDLEGSGYEFLIDGSDLDPGVFPGVDFGYAYWFTPETVPLGSATGPVIAGEPNYPEGPGQQEAFDTYARWDCDPNSYTGSWWSRWPPFPQFYMKLWNNRHDEYPCPGPGNSGEHCTADIDGSDDCIINLDDLSVLLTNYGTLSGMTHYQGDCEPEDGDGVWEPGDGDGDVDLADLAYLLTQYGDDCN